MLFECEGLKWISVGFGVQGLYLGFSIWLVVYGSLKDIFMVLSFQFFVWQIGSGYFGVRVFLRLETGFCEKYRVREGREESFCFQGVVSLKEVVGGLCVRVYKILMTQD